MTNHPLTYGRLREAMGEKMQAEHKPPQSLDNLNGAMKAFQDFFGMRDIDVVGSELRVAYYKTMASHVDALKSLGRNDSYIANRKSYMGAWHKLVISIDREIALKEGALSPFQEAIAELVVKAGSQRALGKEAGVSVATLRRWGNGSRASIRTLPSVRRIERFFGLTDGTLVELAFSEKQLSGPLNLQKAPIAYRERLKSLTKDKYILYDVIDSLKREWQDLMHYKTSIRSGTKARNNAGKWRVTDSKGGPTQEKAWYAYIRGQYVPTAGIAWTRVAAYLGWLQLPRFLGGMQLEPEQAQTLAWLVRDDLIEHYLDWKIQRSGDVVHSGIEEFPRFVSGLVNAKTGYLKLTPTLSSSIVLVGGATWNEQCEQCFRGMKELKQHYGALVKSSRDPFEPIQTILSLVNPLDAVADMTFRMTADRPLTNGTHEAVWARDLALIKLLMSNPLRIKNLQELTWRADNSGQLYQQPDGSWHIKIDRKYFKNHQGAAKERDYHNPVDPMVWPILQQYLSIHRPRLLAGRDSDYVFVSQEVQDGDRPWTRMNRRVFTLTARYLWGCPGVGPHAFRHIVATAILKNSPNDWQTAALVLHDKVETVQKHYAHLRSADGARRMHTLFEKTFARA